MKTAPSPHNSDQTLVTALHFIGKGLSGAEHEVLTRAAQRLDELTFAGQDFIFAEDSELIDCLCPNEHARFVAWFAELNALNAQDENRAPYNGLRLERSTGVKCWFDAFVDGLTPREALDHDYLN